MKLPCSLVLAASLCGTAFAQPGPPVVVVEEAVETLPAREIVTEEVIGPDGGPGETVVEEVVTETIVGEPALDPFDEALVRRRLSILPREVPVVEESTVVTPGSVVETTETTTTIERPGLPRVYNTERNVVIVEGRELPYITIPVLFVKETDELLDSESREALEDTADAILEILETQPDAVFDIEGHTSTDGTDEFNLELSVKRARRVYEELTERYKVPRTALSAHGYGENYPKYPNGTEAQMTHDRRVLVVRVK